MAMGKKPKPQTSNIKTTEAIVEFKNMILDYQKNHFWYVIPMQQHQSGGNPTKGHF